MPRRNRIPHPRPGRGASARARAERDASRAGGRESRLEEDRRRPLAKRPPVDDIVRCVSGKIGWKVEAVAAAKLAEHASSSRPKKPVRIYRCQKCDGWHLTSQPGRS